MRGRSWAYMYPISLLGAGIGGLLACSGDDRSDDAGVSTFPGAGGTTAAQPSGAATAGGGAMAGGGQNSAGIQGMPEDIGQIPLAPGGGGAPAAGGVAGTPATPGQDPGQDPAPPALENVLVFSRTTGYRHDAIGVGIEAIRALGQANGFAVEPTEDPAAFSDERLASFDVVVFLSTTGDVLDDAQQGALERYVRAGGGWVGVHAAADTEYDWPWYGQLLGGNAWFKSHPEIQTVTLNVEESTHAATAHLPASFQLQDEWYNFQANPRSAVRVLMTLDESSYSPGADAMGADHPIAWYHEVEGGRAFYTALGHRPELYVDPVFTNHLLGGIRWAAGVAP